MIVVFALSLPALSVNQLHFTPFDQIRDLMEAMSSAGAPDMPPAEIKDATAWDKWIRARDREIRGRIDRGIEDSIANFILFGTSYSQLPPIPETARTLNSTGDLSSAALDRIHALALALQQPGDNERVRFVRDFLQRKSLAGSNVEIYMRQILQRLVHEEADYEKTLKAAGDSRDQDSVLLGRATIYRDRGLSFDTSLEPDFAIETMLKQMVQKGLISRSSIRRIAVIGPGLDFADKRMGLDFYPVQTLQPFAVLETAARLGLGRLDGMRVVACDLNPAVLAHLSHMSEQARYGRSYVLQLPRGPRNGWDPELVAYWRQFGQIAGSPAHPLTPPSSLQQVDVRAVAIRPQIAAEVTPQDLDIVAQQLDLPAGEGFDLVIATNIFVYYNFFEQALAMQNISRMLNRGGLFIVNQVLSNAHPPSLKLLDQCYVSFSSSKSYGDNVVAYRKD